MTPADELCTAAERLRALTKAIDAPDLPDQSWHVEACASEERGDCPCIVAQGTYSLEHGSVPVFYVADAETPECATYIAAMHPGVGIALALLLEGVASRAVEDAHEECAPYCSPETCEVSAARAVARAINGPQP